MSDIKCIILDIDNTLTKDDDSISEYTKEVLKKTKKQGIYVILRTGRPNEYAIEKSKISNSSPIVISNNGAIIYNYQNDQIIYKNNIPINSLKTIWNNSIEKNIDCVLNALNKRYRHKNFSESDYIKTNYYIEKIEDLKEDVFQIVISSKNYDKLLQYKNEVDKLTQLEVTNTNLYGNTFKDYYFCDINKKEN